MVEIKSISGFNEIPARLNTLQWVVPRALKPSFPIPCGKTSDPLTLLMSSFASLQTFKRYCCVTSPNIIEVIPKLFANTLVSWSSDRDQNYYLEHVPSCLMTSLVLETNCFRKFEDSWLSNNGWGTVSLKVIWNFCKEERKLQNQLSN